MKGIRNFDVLKWRLRNKFDGIFPVTVIEMDLLSVGNGVWVFRRVYEQLPEFKGLCPIRYNRMAKNPGELTGVLKDAFVHKIEKDISITEKYDDVYEYFEMENMKKFESKDYRLMVDDKTGYFCILMKGACAAADRPFSHLILRQKEFFENKNYGAKILPYGTGVNTAGAVLAYAATCKCPWFARNLNEFICRQAFSRQK